MQTPTLTIETAKLSNAAQAVYNRLLRPFADGVIAGTATVDQFRSAQSSVIAILAEGFAGRMWA
jgi:hypothetical protein